MTALSVLLRAPKEETMSATKTRRKGRGEATLFDFPFNGFNHALTTLEKQAGKAYTQLAKTLPKPWGRKLNQLKKQDLVKLAKKKQAQITKEVKFYADGIVKTIHQAHLLPNKNKLAREAKKNLNLFLKKVQKTDVASLAKSLNGNKLLHLFEIPTKKDVAKLNARLSRLEKRFSFLETSAH